MKLRIVILLSIILMSSSPAWGRVQEIIDHVDIPVPVKLVLYSDSRVLKYGPEKNRIHRNYNRWVANLAQAIKQEFAGTYSSAQT